MNVNSCIAVESVTKAFGKKQVLKGLDLTINHGEIFGILGPSGSGKTTLVKIIAGLIKASSGKVFILGEEMPKLEVFKDIGYMAQADALYGELSGYENLNFYASLYGLSGTNKKNRINEVLELVTLKDDYKKPVHFYSGGMKRRLSLAISLIHNPQILILDEPTVGIDPVLRKIIWTELETLKNIGTTIIVTTHVMDEAKKCQRLGMIRDGRLIAKGSYESLLHESKTKDLEDAFLVFGGDRNEN